jgi:hypothetical protein
MPFEREASKGPSGWQWSAVGIEFGVAVVVFFLGGQWLDGKFGSGPWLTLAGSLVGVAVGTYLLIRPLLRTPPKDANPPPEGHDPGKGGPAVPGPRVPGPGVPGPREKG